ncbi:hypothetical protein [Glycomyces buryatensis]|uniref:Uncharacterized protein n=1 Tax=Glycomyces buryatensis TaxID=2570927 RepID=A0A4V4HRR3_9ACTN|nr:hypothetical protein [Glycomyces buryatensis]THV38586.1 hypothetical protein FAB82_19315 [Glycomyces buryatensis]
MELFDQLDPNHLLKQLLGAMGVGSAIIFLVFLYIFAKSWLDTVKTLTEAGKTTRRALRTAIARVRSFTPKQRWSKLTVSGFAVGAQVFVVLLCFLIGQFLSLTGDVDGHWADLDTKTDADPAHYEANLWRLVPLLIQFNWLTAGYLALVLAAYFVSYRWTPQRWWTGLLNVSLASAPSAMVVLPVILCLPCIIPMGLINLVGKLNGGNAGTDPTLVLILLGIALSHMFLCWLTLRLSPIVLNCWTAPRPQTPYESYYGRFS